MLENTQMKNLFTGKIVEVTGLLYIPDENFYKERILLSRFKPITKTHKEIILYKIGTYYIDIKTNKLYTTLNTNEEYTSLKGIPEKGKYYIEESSLLPFNYYNQEKNEKKYVLKRKVLKKSEILTEKSNS